MTSWTIHDPRELTFDAVHVLRLELVGGHVDVVATDDAPRLEVTSVEGEPLTVTHEGATLTVSYDDIPLGGVFGLEGAQTWGRFREWERRGFDRGGPWRGWERGGPWGREEQRDTEQDAGAGPGRVGPTGYGRRGRDEPWSWFAIMRRSATLAVAVPEACQVQLATVSAGAVVSGVSGQVLARDVSGELTLDGLVGEVRVQTVSGDVEARSLGGPVDFATASGDITVASGESGDVRAKTVSGRVTVDLAPPRSARIDVKTVSGDVTVRLPETFGADVRLASMTGDVGAAFEGLSHQRKPGRVTLAGRLGDAAGRLRVKTMSGAVALLRRPSAVTKGEESA